jgi:predicted PurR-regulated permease PerM
LLLNPNPGQPPTLHPTRLFNLTPAQRNRLILVSLAVLGLWWALDQVGTALGPFIFALVIAYLLAPLVDRLGRVMPRVLAVLLIYLVLLALLVVAGLLIVPALIDQIQDLTVNAPRYLQQLQDATRDLQQRYENLNLPPEIQTAIENGLRNALSNAGSTAQTVLFGTLTTVRQVFGFLSGFIVIPFFLFYVLKDKEQAGKWLAGVIPRAWQTDLRRMARIANDIMNDYIRGQLLLGLVVGVATTLGLALVGSPYWLLLGIIAGFTELIPILGPILGAIPALIVAAFHPEGIVMVGKVLLVYVLIQQLENNLLVPKIQGDSVKLHPAVILVVLVVGGQVAGLVGLIVAVPLTAIIRDMFIYLYKRFVDNYSPTVAEDFVPSRQDEEAESAQPPPEVQTRSLSDAP